MDGSSKQEDAALRRASVKEWYMAENELLSWTEASASCCELTRSSTKEAKLARVSWVSRAGYWKWQGPEGVSHRVRLALPKWGSDKMRVAWIGQWSVAVMYALETSMELDKIPVEECAVRSRMERTPA